MEPIFVFIYTVEPPLTATTLQRPPLPATFFVFRTVYTFIRFHLSTTPTFLFPSGQSIHSFVFTSLQRPPLHNSNGT